MYIDTEVDRSIDALLISIYKHMTFFQEQDFEFRLLNEQHVLLKPFPQLCDGAPALPGIIYRRPQGQGRPSRRFPSSVLKESVVLHRRLPARGRPRHPAGHAASLAAPPVPPCEAQGCVARPNAGARAVCESPATALLDSGEGQARGKPLHVRVNNTPCNWSDLPACSY